MKILDSAVNLSASHQAYASQTSEVSVQAGFSSIFSELSGSGDDKKTALQQRVREMLDSMLTTILAALEGKKCLNGVTADTADLSAAADGASASTGNGQRELSWQVMTNVSRREFEATKVCGQGSVCTADGRTIDFGVELAMERASHEEYRLDSVGNVMLKDPLVINFSGQACELTGQRIDFDLDADGTAERLPGLAGSSGYLVFDRNGNGRADDGKELFGATSGDAFAELAALDSDGNGWVDEGDAAFKQLSVWSDGRYASLAERGIGALYTGQVAAPFALKSADHQLLGEIRSAGLYLSENGCAGTMQQVDLAVSAAAEGEQQPGHGQQLAA